MKNLARVVLTAAIGTFVVAAALLPGPLRADTWDPPMTRVFQSANAIYRVIVLPRSYGSTEAGEEPRPRVIVERFEGARFVPDWERKLENRIAPLEALITNDGAYLVTLDNYAAVGKGDDVVVIYRRGGELVRKLSLGQLLPPEYIRFLQRTTTTIAWRGAESLEGDSVLLLQVYEPDSSEERYPLHVPVRIRLSDGEVLPHTGLEWANARGKIVELEEKLQALWEEQKNEHPWPEGKPLPETPPEDFGFNGWQPVD